jgi:hypothetical protein
MRRHLRFLSLSDKYSNIPVYKVDIDLVSANCIAWEFS